MLAGESKGDESMPSGTPSLRRGLGRRRILRRMAAATALAKGPWLIRSARSSSGELNLLHWADQVADTVLSEFTKTTGIKVNSTRFAAEAEQLERLKAADSGFDLCQPAIHRSPQFRETGLLAPFAMDRLPNAEKVIPAMLAASMDMWTWDGGVHHVPHAWGSEGISWRTDVTTLEYEGLSYGTLWSEAYKGKVQGRPHSLLLGIGLWLDATGTLATNRMRDAFKDEATMRSIYDRLLAVAIEKLPWIVQFWDTAAGAAAGFKEKGCVIGQTWDGPIVRMKMDGEPVSYMAPQEGALTWVDGWSMTSAARNAEQAYAFLNYLMTPETSALVAEASQYNPVIAGAEAFMSDAARKSFVEAYPGDALQRLWFLPAEPTWYTEIRVQYAEKLRSAWAPRAR
jgi:spermidine/putrescine transport system substrate-binding protein